MKEIFEQYGGVLITVTAIVAVIGVILFVITGDNPGSSVIYTAFHDLITGFLENAKNSNKIQITIPEVGSEGMLLPIIRILF